MSFNRSLSQRYFESLFPGPQGLPFKGLKKDVYIHRQLSVNEAELFKQYLDSDVGFYYYKALLSFMESLPAIENGNFSWATVRLYYSVYYATKATLACRHIAIVRAERRLFYVKANSGETFVKCTDTTDHKASMYTLRNLYGSVDKLLTQTIDGKLSYEWMMDKREEVNYKDIEFHDPNPPDFWETIHQDVVNHSIVHVVNTLVEDEWLYCFQDDYAVLGIPTKRLLLTVEDIKNTGLNVIINSEQKSFIEAYSNRLTEESKNALLVWN